MFAILAGYSKILSGPVRRCEPRRSANLAARLQALAVADELVIAAATRKLLGGDLGTHRFGRAGVEGHRRARARLGVEGVRKSEDCFEAIRAA